MTDTVNDVAILLSSLKFGGAERAALNLGRALKAEGVQVVFLLMSREGHLLEEAELEFPIESLRCNKTYKLPILLLRYLYKNRPDVLISSFWKLNLCASAARMLLPRFRLILWEHSQPSMSRNSPTWLYAISASIFYRACSRIVAVSSGVSNDIKGITLGLENKLTVIYNPIFPPAQLHDIETPGSRGRKIIWVGRLDDPKNPQLALEAFALVLQAEDLSLTIVGDGRLHSDLRKKSKELGIQDRIKFSGFLTDPYVEMLDSDLLILTSDREGLGNVIVEAMLCGLRVVSTDCGEGVHEVLQEGAYGTIVPVRDAAKMARAIEAELASPSSKEQQIEGARRFLPKSIARQFLTVMGNRVQMP